MAPATYLALCEDTSRLLADYPMAFRDGTMFELEDFPNLLADGGTLWLLDDQDSIMQSVHYTPDWHHPLLQDKRGVSLERISWNGTETEAQIWQSAASTSGFATPGYQNSQWMAQQSSTEMLLADPAIFYPDQSGYLDYTRIYLSSVGPGSMGNLKIFDPQGRLVRRLAQNASLAEKQVFIWDGTDDQHRRAKNGYYIIWAETFDTNGRMRISKAKVAIGSRY
jgi:hypothetical protein